MPGSRVALPAEGHGECARSWWRRAASTRWRRERHEEVSFVEATTWGKLATVCAEHLAKGRGVRVVGRLGQERWEDGDGNARAKIVIVAEHVEVRSGPAACRRP